MLNEKRVRDVIEEEGDRIFLTSAEVPGGFEQFSASEMFPKNKSSTAVTVVAVVLASVMVLHKLANTPEVRYAWQIKAVPSSCKIVNGPFCNRGVVDVTNFVLFALDDHSESVIFEVSLVRSVIPRKRPSIEFQDAFSEVVVAFAERGAGGRLRGRGSSAFVGCEQIREVTIFCPGLLRAPNYLC